VRVREYWWIGGRWINFVLLDMLRFFLLARQVRPRVMGDDTLINRSLNFYNNNYDAFRKLNPKLCYPLGGLKHYSGQGLNDETNRG